MAKNAWLVITDLHLYYKNLANRVDYVEEMINVRADLVGIALKYKEQGYKVNALVLGDIFHRSYRDTFKTGYDNNFFVMWKETFGEIYSVVGNHELSFYKSNPFFTLVSDIKSEKIKQMSQKSWSTEGIMNVIEIVDELQDGDTTFYFNHYGTGIAEPRENEVSIGLFHQEIVCADILQAMKARTGKEIWATTVNFDYLPNLGKYNHCFFGHMHQVYGTWATDTGTVLHYLGSLGRTNVNEVTDSFLERNIPAVIVEDGKFQGVEDNLIQLASYEESVVAVQREEAVEKYQIAKEIKQIKLADVVSDNPVQNLRDFFSNNPELSAMVDELLDSGRDSVSESLQQQVASFMNRR